MATTQFVFTIRGARAGPPPIVVNKTFAYHVANFFIDLEARGYTKVRWDGTVNRNGPTGPSDFTGIINAEHVVPIILPNQQPEVLFDVFVKNIENDGWATQERSVQYKAPG